MMDTERLYNIIEETTVQLRKGPVVEERDVGAAHVTEVWAMPHESTLVDEAYAKVDVSFMVVAVHREQAEARKAELVEVLKGYPSLSRLLEGPSYIEVGAEVGSQEIALRLYALGEVLGFWEVVTPERIGVQGEEARALAGRGFVMVSKTSGLQGLVSA